MKVIWGKFGTGVDLILCVIINPELFTALP